jgi:transcriptional regulator with XRE-family HTH domain
MPRRAKPDPLALAVGRRIRQLREERGLTAEKLVFESDLGSKGYLSDIEHGLASPSLRTLAAIAAHLGIEVVDLLTFPDANERQRLIDQSRFMSRGVIRRLLRDTLEGARRPSRSTYEAAEGEVVTVAEPVRRSSKNAMLDAAPTKVAAKANQPRKRGRSS